MRTDWFLTKMATTKASARTITTLPPTYTRKFVIFTPLRSVHHKNSNEAKKGLALRTHQTEIPFIHVWHVTQREKSKLAPKRGAPLL